MASHSKVLLTGIHGFTGRLLAKQLSDSGLEVVGLQSNLCDTDSLTVEIARLQPTYVVHLAGKSFVGEAYAERFYQVNTIGTENLLKALTKLPSKPIKVVIASSASVYGYQECDTLDESLTPQPQNHYGCSKLAMEHMAQNFRSQLPLLIVRPFNYTGKGQKAEFVIPKIVKVFQSNESKISLGNLEVAREFNDVRDIVRIYQTLLKEPAAIGVVNLCSGRSWSLQQILSIMEKISGKCIKVEQNPLFMRQHDTAILQGSPVKLYQMTSERFRYSIDETLSWMYQEASTY